MYFFHCYFVAVGNKRRLFHLKIYCALKLKIFEYSRTIILLGFCPVKGYTTWNHYHVYIHLRKKGNFLFNNALITFYLRLYGVRHMVKDHTDSKRGNHYCHNFQLAARVLL